MLFERFRKNFPIFRHNLDSNRLIYFDNAATTQRPDEVIGAIIEFYSKYNANILRGVYPLAEQATEMYEKARRTVSSFINAIDSCEVIFTSGTTEGINFVAQAWAEETLESEDEILLTEVEHHANFLPWIRVAEKKGANLKFIKINPTNFKLEFYSNLITEKTKLVAITYSSNVLGDVWNGDDLLKLIARAHEVGAKVLVDAAQFVAHKQIDVSKIKPDFLVFSGHKMLGPTGIGVLYIKKELHEKISPYKVGGSMVFSAVGKYPTWNTAPQKFEAGTPPIAQAIGLGAAIDYLNKNIDFKELIKHESRLCRLLIDGLKKIDGVKILGDIENLKESGHLVSFTVDDVHAHDLASLLGSKNICTRAGHHCAQPLFARLNIEASLRVSFYFYNTEKEVAIFLNELKNAIKFLRG